MPTRIGYATWDGAVNDGKGTVSTESGVLDTSISLGTRTDDGIDGTNSEELLGAAHAGCFSMMLSALLTKAGTPPTRIETTAAVNLTRDEGGLRIDRIDLVTRATVPGLDAATFTQVANQAKEQCPVGKALAATTQTLDATLE